MNKTKCICNICKCGRHKCKHNEKLTNEKLATENTEYNEKYIPHSSKPTKSIKPLIVPISNSIPMSNETTQKNDYIKHELEQRVLKQSVVVPKKEEKFNGMSVYNLEYTKKNVDQVKPIKPLTENKSKEEFSAEATYKRDYRKWSAKKSEPTQTKAKYTPSQEVFEGEGTYALHYINHGNVYPRKNLRPREHSINNQEDYNIIYSSDYRDKFVPPPYDYVPRKQLVPVPKSLELEPFEGISTSATDYVQKPIEKQQGFKPVDQAVPSETPFADETTNKVDYKVWPLQETFKHTTEEYQPTKEEFIDSTTYKTTYLPNNVDQTRKIIKPKSAELNENREFYSSTDYNDNYRNVLTTDCTIACSKEPKYQPPDVLFEGISIQKSDYISYESIQKRNSSKNSSIQKTDVLNVDLSQLENETHYRTDFIAKKIEICPVLLLNQDNGMILKQTEDGHQVYISKIDDCIQISD